MDFNVKNFTLPLKWAVLFCLVLFLFFSCNENVPNKDDDKLADSLYHPNCIPEPDLTDESFGHGGCWFTLWYHLNPDLTTLLVVDINPEIILLDSICRKYSLVENGISARVEIKPSEDYYFDVCGDLLHESEPIVDLVVSGTITISSSKNFSDYNEEVQDSMLLNGDAFQVSAMLDSIQVMGSDTLIDNIVFYKNTQIII